MSPTMPERLRELENDVQDLRVRPAADIRARGRTRARRQMAAAATAGAVVAVTAGVALTWPRPDDPTPPPPAAAAPTPLNCVLTLPSEPADVELRVLNGGVPAARLQSTAVALRERGFSLLFTQTAADPETTTVLRYGPAAIGAAHLMRAELHGDVTMRFDPAHRDKAVDVILAPSFDRLATPTEFNQNLVAAGEPTAPPEC
jgi:hypothetical protein